MASELNCYDYVITIKDSNDVISTKTRSEIAYDHKEADRKLNNTLSCIDETVLDIELVMVTPIKA